MQLMTSSKSHLVFFDWDSTFASKIRDKEISVLNENVLKTLGLVYKVLKDFMRFRGSLHALSHHGGEIRPGVDSFRSLKKSLILLTRNKRGEIPPRP